MLDTARGLVSQELSAARSVDRATVEKELESVLNEGQA
jgi:RNA polymerase-interacting CarD/CdnL/TRCF family regulator